MLKFTMKFFITLLFVVSISLQSGGNLKGEGNHTFYTYNKSSNAKITTVMEKQSQNFIYFKNRLMGESVEFFEKDNANKLILKLNANLIFTEKGDDFYCEYYYSPKIKDYIVINGEKINLHVSYAKDVIIVGYPLIFGSF